MESSVELAADIPLEEIHTRSGTVLLVGDANGKRRLLVSYTFLSQASRCFDNIFGLEYLEGQIQGTSAQPKRIEPFDENAAMMSDMSAFAYMYDKESNELELLVPLPCARTWSIKAKFLSCDAYFAIPCASLQP